jgi:hypothetical protein
MMHVIDVFAARTLIRCQSQPDHQTVRYIRTQISFLSADVHSQDAEAESKSQENSSCSNSRSEGYFGNWAVRFVEVACPSSLTSVTGLKPDYASAGVTGLPSPAAGLADNGTPGDTSTMQVGKQVGRIHQVNHIMHAMTRRLLKRGGVSCCSIGSRAARWGLVLLDSGLLPPFVCNAGQCQEH